MTYEGAEWLSYIHRNPVPIATKHFGGEERDISKIINNLKGVQ